VLGHLVANEELLKMNNSEWSQQMMESLYLVWF
jgi:hypothetical protein